MTTAARTGSPLQSALLAAVLATLGFLTWRVLELESRAQRTTAGLERVEKVLELLRIESAENVSGVGAVIEHIEHWAPKLSLASTNAAMAIDVRARLERTLDSVETIGPEAFDDLVQAIDTNEHRDVQHWLMRALGRADKARAIEVVSDITRGIEHAPNAHTRLRAARLLIELDERAAGNTIKDVLLYESARGMVREPPPQLRTRYENFVRNEQFPLYFHFIELFVRTGHPDVEPTLLMLLLRDDHDKMTYQECMKQLAKLGSTAAVDRIKRLFIRPPFGFPDPIFKNICLDAIAEIEGEPATEFLELQLRESHSETVQTKLRDLLKRLRSGD